MLRLYSSFLNDNNNMGALSRSPVFPSTNFADFAQTCPSAMLSRFVYPFIECEPFEAPNERLQKVSDVLVSVEGALSFQTSCFGCLAFCASSLTPQSDGRKAYGTLD